MKWNEAFSAIFGALGILVNHLWGGLDALLIILITVMSLDFISALIYGGKNGVLDSNKAFVGITKKKMMIFIMVAVSVVADNIAKADGSIRSAVLFFYTSMECLSIIETSGKIGLPVPQKIMDMFAQLQNNEK